MGSEMRGMPRKDNARSNLAVSIKTSSTWNKISALSPEILCQSSFSLFFLQPLLLRRPTLRFWRHLGNLSRQLWSCLRRHWRLWHLPYLPGFLVRLGHRYRGWGGWTGRSNWRWHFWWRFWVGSAGCIGINQRNAGSRFNFWWGWAGTL